MTAPFATPLILRSSFVGKLNASTNTAMNAAVLDKIIEESERIQRWCGRRFDEHIETRSYTARHVSQGGSLYSTYELWLDDDLRALTTFKYLVDPFTPGSGTTISSGYLLVSPGSRYGVTAYDTIRLNPYGTTFFYTVYDPTNSITVAGTWGYGGQWRNTGYTVASGLASSSSATSFVSSTALEAGMMLKIESEYIYVNTVTGTTNTIDRACNGSTAATHANATAIYRWEADPLVQRHVARLVLISIAQDTSPLFANLIVGDFQTAVQSDGNPKDVLYDVQKAGLRRVVMPVGI